MTAAADLQVPNVETVLRRAATRLARAAGCEVLDEGQVLQLVDVVRDQIVHPLAAGTPAEPDSQLLAELERVRAELVETQRAAREADARAEQWEREHQNTVLPYTSKVEDERDQARAERAALWELVKAAVRERGQAWAEAARLEEALDERSSSDAERHRHYYPAEQPGQTPGPCACGKPWPRAQTAEPDDEPATEPDPWDRIFTGLRDDLADWPPQQRSKP